MSSWVLRKLFHNVVCVDPDAGYLRLVAELCGRHGLSTAGFVGPPRECPVADYTFYEYGGWEVRWPPLAAAWEKTRLAIYIDDTDDRPHNQTDRAFARAFTAELDLALDDRPDAIDEHGRWRSWARRGGGSPVG